MNTAVTNNLASQSATSAENADTAQRFSNDYDTFLKLLTTQLQHQNPLEPLDTHQFMAQIGQFSYVEQQIQMNRNLTALLNVMSGQQSGNAIGYLGKEITASNATGELGNTGGVTWKYTSDPALAVAQIVIKNGQGTVVRTDTAFRGGGTSHAYQWDGRTNQGTRAPKGSYTLQISGQNSNGESVQVTTQITGKVEEVDMNGGNPVLIIQGQRILLSEVTRIKDAP